MINADAVAVTATPIVFGVALMFGGLAQLIVGIIQLRTGNTFSGVLFAGFGVSRMSRRLDAAVLVDLGPSVAAGAPGASTYLAIAAHRIRLITGALGSGYGCRLAPRARRLTSRATLTLRLRCGVPILAEVWRPCLQTFSL
jgi:GPR1/FUN34/yaaH family